MDRRSGDVCGDENEGGNVVSLSNAHSVLHDSRPRIEYVRHGVAENSDNNKIKTKQNNKKKKGIT